MYFLNLTLGQFLVLFGSVSAVMVALYLLDRSRRKQIVSTLRFWMAAEQPTVVVRRKRIQQPLSLILQLISMALLLLAIAQLRWGTQAGQPRDHVLILETSAWMAARTGARNGSAPHNLMEIARQRAHAYARAIPARDRLMLVRADALATPATAFEPDRTKIDEAIERSEPGSTALNLDQALSFARQVQAQSGRRAGEIVFVGTGKIAERDAAAASRAAPRNLRVLPVQEAIENCGLRKIGVRRAAADSDLWEIYVSARNYGSRRRTVTLSLGFGPSPDGAASSPVGSQRLTLAPGADGEASFTYRTRAAGFLEANLLPRDAFSEDDRAVLELPSLKSLRVAVYSSQPDLLRPVLNASPRVTAVFRKPSEYVAAGDADLVLLDRFRPPAPPQMDSIWIDPPAQGSPIPIRAHPENVPFSHWLPDHALGAGLRTKDFRLESASVFEAAPGDVKIGEVEGGPVIVARPGKPKTVVFGFHPTLSAMRYELATPLLFAHILRWMAPEVFRRWELSGASVGTVRIALDPDARAADVRVLTETGSPVPFTLRDRSLDFFSGIPGTVRVVTGDSEYVYSLTLPQLWESKWEMPAEARHGIPRFQSAESSSFDLWQILTILGAIGLLTEWFLFGHFRRTYGRAAAAIRMSRKPGKGGRVAGWMRMVRG